jgi:MFS family permease
MYLSTRSLAAAGRREDGDSAPATAGGPDDPAARARPGPGAASATGLERNVWLLGLTSLFTDVSSEMVASVLPLYLTLFFGFTPLLFGAFDGAYQGLTALAAIAAAVGADRGRRHKLTAGVGYVLSAVCTLGLVAARGAWGATVGLLYLTRLGKGVRTAPRDALISLSVAPGRLGRAFGVHRAFDTVGAVAGPVAASLLLARDPVGYGTVFAVGFFVAVIGVATLVVFVQDAPAREPVAAPVAEPAVPVAEAAVPGTETAMPGTETAVPVAETAVRGPRRRVGPRSWRIVWAGAPGLRRFRLVLVAGASLAVMRPGDGLLFLAFQRDSALSAAQFPLLFSAASVMFLVAAAPLGLLADRIGRLRVFVLGEVLVAGALAVLASGARGTGALVVMLGLLGASYAATDGVLVAMASAALPDRWRTTGLALVATVIAGGRFVASIGFGVLWERFGGPAAARVFLAGVAVSVVVGLVLLRCDDGAPGGPDAEPTPGHPGRGRDGRTGRGGTDDAGRQEA